MLSKRCRVDFSTFASPRDKDCEDTFEAIEIISASAWSPAMSLVTRCNMFVCGCLYGGISNGRLMFIIAFVHTQSSGPLNLQILVLPITFCFLLPPNLPRQSQFAPMLS